MHNNSLWYAWSKRRITIATSRSTPHGQICYAVNSNTDTLWHNCQVSGQFNHHNRTAYKANKKQLVFF